MMNLNELFELYRNNPSENNLTEVLKNSQSLIYSIAFNIIKHNQDAEDLTQDVLIKIINHINLLPKNTNFPGWLNRTSLHAAIDLYNQKKRAKTLSSEFQNSPKNQTTENVDETISIVYQHLAKLGDSEKSMIIDKHIHQMTYVQLSNLYHLPVPTLQTKLETILSRLKSSIEKAGFASVAIGLATTFEQIKQPNIALDFLPKLKMHFPTTYPNANFTVLTAKASTNSITNAIYGKMLTIIIGAVLLLSFTVLYFVFDIVSREEMPENEKLEITKNSPATKNDNQKTDNIAISKIQNTETPHQNGNPKVGAQTFVSPIVQVEKHQEAKEVLGIDSEKVDIEITLMDGELNKVMAEKDVELKIDGESILTKNFKTDQNGKFHFTDSKLNLRIQLMTKDYAFHSKYLELHFGKNAYQAKLYKGCVLEVHAKNPANNIVDGLKIRLLGYPLSIDASPFFDAEKGAYIIPNMAAGNQLIWFEAKGYQNTTQYSIRINSNNKTIFNVIIKPTRKIFFDLDILPKPGIIEIALDFPNAENKQLAVKNHNNLYEYELGSQFSSASSLRSISTVYIKKYAPQFIKILPEVDFYQLTMFEKISGELKITNEAGQAIVGASITYSGPIIDTSLPEDASLSSRSIYGVAESGKDGIAILTGLNQNNLLDLKISHKEYAEFNEKWSFDEKKNSSKTIILSEGKNLSGKIKVGENVVMGAMVYLYPTGNYSARLEMVSEIDGSYHFNNLECKKNKEYTIQAFHRDFGIMKPQIIILENKNQVIDLTLTTEKSASFKLVDINGVPLANKQIKFSYGNQHFFQNMLTNEKGEYECFNLMPDLYYIGLDDDKFWCKGIKLSIPTKTNAQIVLVAEQKFKKKIVITTPGGGVFNGVFKVKQRPYFGSSYPEISKSEDGNYYFEYLAESNLINSQLFIEAQGYAIATIGPFKKNEVPEELMVELTEGENVKIIVLDERNNLPIPFVNVEILIGKEPLQILQTNNLGEVFLTNLSGKYSVVVNAEKFVPFKYEFDVSNTKEVLVKLIKGGGLKGHLTPIKESTYSIASDSSLERVVIDRDGNFEFFNLKPGEISLLLTETVKTSMNSSKQSTKKIPGKIIIENEKIKEVNLDDILKK